MLAFLVFKHFQYFCIACYTYNIRCTTTLMNKRDRTNLEFDICYWLDLMNKLLTFTISVLIKKLAVFAISHFLIRYPYYSKIKSKVISMICHFIKSLLDFSLKSFSPDNDVIVVIWLLLTLEFWSGDETSVINVVPWLASFLEMCFD